MKRAAAMPIRVGRRRFSFSGRIVLGIEEKTYFALREANLSIFSGEAISHSDIALRSCRSALPIIYLMICFSSIIS